MRRLRDELLREPCTWTPYADLAGLAIHAAKEHQHRIVIAPPNLQLPDALTRHSEGVAESKVRAFEVGHADYIGWNTPGL